MTEARAWPKDWSERRQGAGCGMCAAAGERDDGIRVFEGRWSNAYLGRFPLRPGYTFVVWKGRHVAEPSELSRAEAAGFWSEVTGIAAALDHYLAPAKMNWLLLGNGVPHLHVHLIPRPFDDVRAGGPLETEAFSEARNRPLDDDTLTSQATALRALIT